MPRPNKPRTVDREDALARRIGYERKARGWTYDSLAARMTSAGCPIDQSAIYKIEKAEPRRRITVDELVAFAQVFGYTNVDELLDPPELVEYHEASRLMGAATSAVYEREQAQRAELVAIKQLMAHLDAHPNAAKAILDAAGDAEHNDYLSDHLDYFAAVRGSEKPWDDPFADPEPWPNLLAVPPAKRSRPRG